uniref:Uncharacterized protein n=1 Tax=Anguilla anguilla TaxID=7936 RepID=A0A0E9P507_ANGAN
MVQEQKLEHAWYLLCAIK